MMFLFPFFADKQLQEKALNNQELRIQELKKELEMVSETIF